MKIIPAQAAGDIEAVRELFCAYERLLGVVYWERALLNPRTRAG